MADKINMSLDDIIKITKQQAKKSAPVKAGKQVRGNKRVVVSAARKGRGAPNTPYRGGQGNRFNNNNGRTSTAAETKKLVQKLVKKALKTQRPAAATMAARRGGINNRVLPTLGGRVNLGRVNARSRVIGGARAINRPVVQAVQRIRRGRGFGNAVQTVYEDEIEQPVQIVQRAPRRQFVQQQPVVVQRVVRVPRRQRIVQQQPQRVIIQQQQPRQRVIQQQQPRQRVIVQQQPRQRVMQQQSRQRVIMVQQQRRAPVQQRVQKVIQRVRPQVIQRVQRIPQQQRRTEVVEYVEARNRKNDNFRNAIQGGRGRFNQVDRFEPSTSFIQRSTVVRRGRGFDNY